MKKEISKKDIEILQRIADNPQIAEQARQDARKLLEVWKEKETLPAQTIPEAKPKKQEALPAPENSMAMMLDNQAITEEALRQCFEDYAEPERIVNFTKANFKKEFETGFVTSKIGQEIVFNDRVYTKLDTRGTRKMLLGLIRPTLENPILVVKQKDGNYLYFKSFKKSADNSILLMLSVSQEMSEMVVSASNFEVPFYTIVKKANDGEVAFYFCSQGTIPTLGNSGNNAPHKTANIISDSKDKAKNETSKESEGKVKEEYIPYHSSYPKKYSVNLLDFLHIQENEITGLYKKTKNPIYEKTTIIHGLRTLLEDRKDAASYQALFDLFVHYYAITTSDLAKKALKIGLFGASSEPQYENDIDLNEAKSKSAVKNVEVVILYFLKKAITEGKPVPAEVLKEYPDALPAETAQAGKATEKPAISADTQKLLAFRLKVLTKSLPTLTGEQAKLIAFQIKVLTKSLQKI